MLKRSVPPYHALHVLVAVGEYGSIRAAARHIGRSESAVSHLLKDLERRLGQTLLERKGRGVELTPLALRYVSRLREPFQHIDKATAELFVDPIPRHVVLTLPPTLATLWLVPAITDFEKVLPEIELRLITTNRTLDLRRDGIDLAIRYREDGRPSTQSTLTLPEYAFPVCAPSLAERLRKRLEALAEVRRLVNDGHYEEWAVWQGALGEPVALSERTERLADSTLTLEAAAQGYAVAMGRTPLVNGMLASGRLIAPMGTHYPTGAIYEVVCDDQSMHPEACQRVIDWIGQQFARPFMVGGIPVPTQSA
ncbi:LysR substrate-binding domain-containing protein [Chromohalobacter nigrandesensis]|uniref:LysR substrate-binding domain-containing protein n=1 Tax=Chromohalobacter nigrandesensis TaxID=119863 RepID=UPI001FF4E5E1|nr:LysR substrate-binding domain-containing protein [Chromohalobacter nigrandesensis]MCK0744642.1 LysR substrate-binding domain-containing protein [Chromohalobacter nigrandesensis]